MITQETALLTRKTMNRLAAGAGVSINVKKRPPHVHVYLRDHGTLIYLGYLDALELLGEAEFAAKVTEKLTRGAWALEAL